MRGGVLESREKGHASVLPVVHPCHRVWTRWCAFTTPRYHYTRTSSKGWTGLEYKQTSLSLIHFNSEESTIYCNPPSLTLLQTYSETAPRCRSEKLVLLHEQSDNPEAQSHVTCTGPPSASELVRIVLFGPEQCNQEWDVHQRLVELRYLLFLLLPILHHPITSSLVVAASNRHKYLIHANTQSGVFPNTLRWGIMKGLGG